MFSTCNLIEKTLNGLPVVDTALLYDLTIFQVRILQLDRRGCSSLVGCPQNDSRHRLNI